MKMQKSGMTALVTGLSDACKTTICKAVEQKILEQGYKVEVLDGDLVRENLTKSLGFSKKDRDENIRRIGFVAQLLTRNGMAVLVAAISPYRDVRNKFRQKIGNFIEVYVNAPLDVCQQRDIKGLYQEPRWGEIKFFTGIDDPYEPPTHPEVECQTKCDTLDEKVAKVIEAIFAVNNCDPILLIHAQ
jgi:adenylylsulfate kinase